VGVLGRILNRRVDRRRGVLAEDRDEPSDPPRLAAPPPTAGTKPLQAPEPTPSMRRLPRTGETAGTRAPRFPGGTPSTERLHNPRQHGR
jgi:hypothetical protein